MKYKKGDIFSIFYLQSLLRTIKKNVDDSEDSYVCIFPDELPTEHNDLIDVLRSALAPLKAWRQCAVEYHRQGYDIEFESILNDIVVNLENKGLHTVKLFIKNKCVIFFIIMFFRDRIHVPWSG